MRNTFLIVLALCLSVNLVCGKSLRKQDEWQEVGTQEPSVYQIRQYDYANVLLICVNNFQAACNKPGVKLPFLISTTQTGTTTGATYKFVFRAVSSTNVVLPNLTINAQHGLPNAQGGYTVYFNCA